ncbi:MAG TPA: hypothetical protein VF041_19350 [Gemmatimonadaceae bacterium]
MAESRQPRRPERRERRLCALLVLLLTSCSPPFTSRAEVDITGEFRADGSCVVRADGVPLYADLDRARTVHETGVAPDEARAGWVVHRVSCLPSAVGLIRSDRRDFALAFVVRGAGPPRPGTYTVTPDALVRGVPGTIGGAYFDPVRYGPDSPGSGILDLGGDVYLAITSGEARLTRIDSTRVVGSFRMRAVRRWSM